MSCSCNNKDLGVCDEPKASAQQLDMLRSMIRCLCKCGDTPVDVPEEEIPDVDIPSCIATFSEVRPIDGFPDRITYSKNGGPFREISFFDVEPDGLPSVSYMLKNESLTEFAFIILERFDSNTGVLLELCGFNSDGSYVSSTNPDGFKPTELFMPEGIYEGPFNVKEEKNTLTFKATEGVPDYQDFFSCLNNPTGASTLTLESCTVLETLSDPVPPPSSV